MSWNKSWKELFWEAKINQSGSSMHHIPKFNLWPISNHKVYAFYARKKGWYLRYNDTILTQCLKIDQKSYCERSELRLVTNETIEFFSLVFNKFVKAWLWFTFTRKIAKIIWLKKFVKNQFSIHFGPITAQNQNSMICLLLKTSHIAKVPGLIPGTIFYSLIFFFWPRVA